MNSENKIAYKNGVSHLIIRYSDAVNDPKLRATGNNGRKFLVNEMYETKECHIQKGLDLEFPDFVIWKADADGKVPILEVGYGGTEGATFTDQAKQDRHKHLIGTEFYTILEGKMKIKINDKEIELDEKDEAVILPATVHTIIPENSKFVTRVHFVNGYGNDDKYIETDGEWKLAKDVK